MSKYEPNTREQILELKDGRTIFRTHNGFKNWVTDAHGKTTEVDEAYYLKSKKHAIKFKK